MEIFMIRALFFQAYYSYLKGDFHDTEMFFSFLKEEVKARKGTKDPKILTQKQLRILKEIKFSLKNGKIETSKWIDDDESPTTLMGTEPEIKQPELLKKIYFESLPCLRTILKSNELELHNIEHPCGQYGAVDMVFRDKEFFYPVEVKRHEGKHDLIGQIAKYTTFFKFGLHLNVYFDVQPVTICNSYNPHTLTKLKRMSVIPLIYTLQDGKVKISQV